MTIALVSSFIKPPDLCLFSYTRLSYDTLVLLLSGYCGYYEPHISGNGGGGSLFISKLVVMFLIFHILSWFNLSNLSLSIYMKVSFLTPSCRIYGPPNSVINDFLSKFDALLLHLLKIY
jgi:hypothetical protein